MTDTTTNQGAVATALSGGSADQTSGSNQQTSGDTQTQEKFWYSNLDPVLQGNLEKKGWKNEAALPKALESYFELEKQYRSGDKVMWPKDENDKEGWNTVYSKWGRPESADKYVFPEGVDQNLAKEMAAVMYEQGIPQKAANAMAVRQLQLAQTQQAMEHQRVKEDGDKADRELKQEWGNKYEENVEFARRGMRGFGLDLDKNFFPLAASLGAKNAMTIMSMIGSHPKVRESNAAEIGDMQAGFGLTPHRAKAELAEKGAELYKRARDGDKGAAAHRRRLIIEASKLDNNGEPFIA